MNFEAEEKSWRQGRVLIGVDEAGRGPLAGPVVAAAVVIRSRTRSSKLNPSADGQNIKLLSPATRDDFQDLLKLGVNDSKKLTPKKREKIYNVLTDDKHVLWAVGVVDEKTIDKINILQASLRAMKKAVSALLLMPYVHNDEADIYIDGREVISGLSIDQKAVIGGDGKIFSIAAASIIAKVTRDRMMDKYAKQYPQYQFERHKGYGTKLHFEMIKAHGVSPIHRRSFLKFKK